MKSMKNAAETAVVTTAETAATTAETVAPAVLGLTKFTLPSGEYEGVKIYAVSYLPARQGEDGKELQSTFGGLLEKFVDPGTGEVRGVRGSRDAVPLSFFGPSAEKWARVLLEPWVDKDGVTQPPRISDVKRDSVILGLRPEAEELTVLRSTDGRLKTVIASSRTFSGKIKVLVASPEVEFEVG